MFCSECGFFFFGMLLGLGDMKRILLQYTLLSNHLSGPTEIYVQGTCFRHSLQCEVQTTEFLRPFQCSRLLSLGRSQQAVIIIYLLSPLQFCMWKQIKTLLCLPLCSITLLSKPCMLTFRISFNNTYTVHVVQLFPCLSWISIISFRVVSVSDRRWGTTAGTLKTHPRGCRNVSDHVKPVIG